MNEIEHGRSVKYMRDGTGRTCEHDAKGAFTDLVLDLEVPANDVV